MASTETAIPRIAHFVFGLDPRDEPFHLVHYLAIASCLERVAPEEVHLHCARLPHGFYWDLIRPRVRLARIEPVRAVAEHPYEPQIGRYAYAHHADFVRLDVLSRWGGLYADIDTLFVRAVPPRCWRARAVVGREANVEVEPGRRRRSVSNALIMSEPGGRFVETWRERSAAAFDGSWSAHSCQLAAELAGEMPAAVRVEPRRTFHAFEASTPALRRLLLGPAVSLERIVSLHLMAHLWWDEDRRDFLEDLHARMIDERWIRERDSAFAAAARALLPAHDEF